MDNYSIIKEIIEIKNQIEKVQISEFHENLKSELPKFLMQQGCSNIPNFRIFLLSKIITKEKREIIF